MALEKVRAGEAVKASTINSLVDSVVGTQTPSPDLQYTKTEKGTQVMLPSRFGGPNRGMGQLLEVGSCRLPGELSGWPFVSILAGSKIDDCLNSIRLHNSLGQTYGATSAAVIFKNSEDCPTGDDLSGYLLEEKDFGTDKSIRASGWIDTLIEDRNGNPAIYAQLWSWSKPDGMAVVFTNVDSDLSVKSQLSSLLDGEVDSEVLEELKQEGSWCLVKSNSLSSEDGHHHVTWTPTHPVVMKKGVIDTYDSSSVDQKVVMKANLQCLSVQTREDEVTDTEVLDKSYWGWKIWLGEDAQYDSDLGLAYGSGVMVGGNKVVFEATDQDEDNKDKFEDGWLYHGRFEVQQGRKLTQRKLWLNLSNDIDHCMIRGTLESTGSSPSGLSQGLANKSSFVAKFTEWTPPDTTAVGDIVPAECLSFGTYGHLLESYPLLDSYSLSGGSFPVKSLDWTTRESDDSPFEEKSVQIHDFEQGPVTNNLSAEDLVLFRRQTEEGIELKYAPLSGLVLSGTGVETIGDTDWADHDLSSIETLSSSPNGMRVLQLFKFDQGEKIDARLSDLLSVDFVVRKGDTVDYLDLSWLHLSSRIPDTSLFPDEQNSLEEVRVMDGEEQMMWQLYHFDQEGEDLSCQLSARADDYQPLLASGNEDEDYEFVLRKTSNGKKEIAYGNVQISAITPVDSDDNQKSIEFGPHGLQLWDFDDADVEEQSLMVPLWNSHQISCALSGALFRELSGGTPVLSYKDIYLRQQPISVDNDLYWLNLFPNDIKTRSLTWLELDEQSGAEKLMLYNFGNNPAPFYAVLSSSSGDRLLSSNCSFLTKQVVNGKWTLTYTDLCVGLSCDTDGGTDQKSIEHGSYGLQLYGIDDQGDNTEIHITNKSLHWLCPDDCEFVMRTKQGGEITYGDIGIKFDLSANGGYIPLSGDSQYSGINQKSIELITPNYYQLYNFDDHTTTDALSSDHVLIRSGSELKYAPLSSIVHISVDNQSIEFKDDPDDTLQIKDWDANEEANVSCFSETSGWSFVVRNNTTKDAEYVNLGNLSACYPDMHSLGYTTNGECEININGWDVASSIVVDEFSQTSGWSILARNDSTLSTMYLDLSQISCGGGGFSGLSVDNVSLSTDTNGKACIKGWNEDTIVHLTSVEQLKSYNGFVARDNNGQLKYLDLSALFGGSSGGLPGPFEPTITKNNGTVTVQMRNCVHRIARSYCFFADQTVSFSDADVVVYSGVEHTNPPTCTCFTGLYANAQQYLEWGTNCISATVTPLFRISNGEVVCDYRPMMNIQAYDHMAADSARPW